MPPSHSQPRRRLRDEPGFTLVELLVVIMIIGVLAAIAMPTFLSRTAKAHDSAALSNDLEYGPADGQVEVSSASQDA